MNTNKKLPSEQQTIAALVGQAQLDACDMSFLIKSALQSFDEDPQTAFALLRSVDMFSDCIFNSLTKADEQLNPRGDKNGGAA